VAPALLLTGGPIFTLASPPHDLSSTDAYDLAVSRVSALVFLWGHHANATNNNPTDTNTGVVIRTSTTGGPSSGCCRSSNHGTPTSAAQIAPSDFSVSIAPSLSTARVTLPVEPTTGITRPTSLPSAKRALPLGYRDDEEDLSFDRSDGTGAGEVDFWRAEMRCVRAVQLSAGSREPPPVSEGSSPLGARVAVAWAAVLTSAVFLAWAF
jgi:hypothetical protein